MAPITGGSSDGEVPGSYTRRSWRLVSNAWASSHRRWHACDAAQSVADHRRAYPGCLESPDFGAVIL